MGALRRGYEVTKLRGYGGTGVRGYVGTGLRGYGGTKLISYNLLALFKMLFISPESIILRSLILF